MANELENKIKAIQNKKMEVLQEKMNTCDTENKNKDIEIASLREGNEKLSTEVTKLHQEKCVEVNDFCAATRAGTETHAETIKFCGESIPDYCEPSS